MVKSPIEYFEEQVFEASSEYAELNVAEWSFLQKYVGLDYDIATVLPSQVRVAKTPLPETLDLEESLLQTAHGKLPETAENVHSWDKSLQEDAQSLFMTFQLSGQTYAVPALAVGEVIQNMVSANLPMTSPALRGVINFRSRVTPLICIATLLEECNQGVSLNQEDGEAAKKTNSSAGFVAICQSNGLQFGLLIDSIDIMHTVPKDDLIWDLASALGVDTTYIAALYVQAPKIIPILSIDRIMASILH